MDNNIYDYSNSVQDYWRNKSGNTAILPNITNFRATIDEEDKSLIHLTWDAINIPNFSHYEIRCSKDWQLDSRLGNIPNNKIITDNLTDNRLDYRVYNLSNGWVKDVTFWIAAYDTKMNRSISPVSIKLTYNAEPEKVSLILLEQDNSNKKLIHISWNPIENSQLDRYVIVVQEENTKPVFLYSNKSTTNLDYYVSHSGIMQVSVSAQLSSGVRIQNPEKALYNVSIAPNPIENLTMSVNNNSLLLTWEEPLNDNNTDVEYHYVVTKFNISDETFKVIINDNMNSNIYTQLNNDYIVIDKGIIQTLAHNQGYEISRDFTKSLNTSIELNGKGLYKLQMFVHRHTFFNNTSNYRINEVYESPSIIKYIYVK